MAMRALAFLTLNLILGSFTSSLASNVDLTLSEKAFIERHPTIIIGAGESFEPYVIRNQDGSISGFDVDIANEIERVTGLNFAFKLDHWGSILEQAKDKQVDGISAAIPSKARLQYLSATKSYIASTNVVFVSRGNPLGLKNPQDLVGRKVALQTGNILLEKALQHVSDSLTVIHTDTIHEQIGNLVSGSVDFIVLDETAPYLANKMGLGAFIEPAFTLGKPHQLHFLFRSDWPELTSLFDKALAQIPAHEMQKIRTRWFESAQSKTDYGPLIRVALLSLLVLVFLFFWAMTLRRARLRAEHLLAELKTKDAALLKANESLRKMANTDHLTGLNNRVTLDHELKLAIEKANRYQQPFAVIMLDIDHFKAINDEFGHLAGDQVLIELAALMLTNCRSVDVVGRWGGEEFLIVSFNQSPEDTIAHANKLREAFSEHDFTDVGQVTASFGVAHYQTGENRRTLVNRADKALYRAKQEGRNRVVVCDEPFKGISNNSGQSSE